jgi:hypothetical protein
MEGEEQSESQFLCAGAADSTGERVRNSTESDRPWSLLVDEAPWIGKNRIDWVTVATGISKMADRFQIGLKELILLMLLASVVVGIGVKYPRGTILTVGGAATAIAVIVLLRRGQRLAATVVAILPLLWGPLVEMKFHTRTPHRWLRAKVEVKKLSIAVEVYKLNLGAFPPDSLIDPSGAQFSTSLLRIGVSKNDVPSLSPYNAGYSFVEMNPGQQDSFDPGPDKLLGGTLDPQKGFVPDGSDANRDGVPDDQDNIRSDQLD